ncbi:MAG: hypothetical protein HY390_03265 [Deltaproteobacteria bacterium]|nr:hypothetical protein [Deltaproteobacteria bacterium]
MKFKSYKTSVTKEKRASNEKTKGPATPTRTKNPPVVEALLQKQIPDKTAEKTVETIFLDELKK